ncbi:MAG: DUF3088 domain-containing protein [Fimbriiglobus sp.]|jgi:hypothetical protein|nr:DUF3088 domain-containing protein [Fimbriiglobus sp.]
MADVLFLLKPTFSDAKAGPGTFYCPPCATVRGFLGYFPQAAAGLEVTEVDFPRPRGPVAAVLGEQHPGCPVLVLDDASTPPAGITVHTATTGKRYLDGPADIGNYLAAKHGVSRPHP